MKTTITVEHEIEYEGKYCTGGVGHWCGGILDRGAPTFSKCKYFELAEIEWQDGKGYLRCPECLKATGDDKPERVKPGTMTGHNIMLDDSDAKELERTAEDDLRDFGVTGNDKQEVKG